MVTRRLHREPSLASLIRRMGREDGGALAAFLRSEFAGRVRRVLAKELRESSQVEDAMQEGALKLWLAVRANPLENEDSLRAWVFRIFVNAARDLGRKTRRQSDAEWTAIAVEGRDEACSDLGVREVEARDTARALLKIVEPRLTWAELEVMRADLAAGGRCEDPPLADLLGTSRSHVRVLRCRIHQKLEEDGLLDDFLCACADDENGSASGATFLS